MNRLQIVTRALVAIAIISIVALGVILVYTRGSADSREGPTVQIDAGGKTITYCVEVADSSDEITRGLMNRTWLAPDAGMLFVFDGEVDHYFWMKNTLIPLDMIYISSDGRVVGVRENAVPGSTDAIEPPGPSRYVLEVNGGQCSQYGISVGDQVTISLA